MALALLLVSPVEQSHGPYVRIDHETRIALAASRNGILIAWSELVAGRSRIRTALADFNGRIASPIHTLPVARENADAFAPSVASDGASFYLLQLEASSSQATDGIPLDATGAPTDAPRTLIASYTLTPSVAVPTSIVWNGASYLATVPLTRLSIGPDGTVLSSTPLPRATWNATTSRGLTSAAWRRTPATFPAPCSPLSNICITFGFRSDLDWSTGQKSGSYFPRYEPSTGRATVAGNRSESLIAWTSGNHVAWFIVDAQPREAVFPASVDATQDPSLACDEQHCILAYGTAAGDVHGLLFEAGRPDTPSHFAIATSGRIESHPEVVRAGDGRFIVAYFSDLAGDARLATRVITTRPQRTRAVR